MQTIIDKIMSDARAERSQTQFTLRRLITLLVFIPETNLIEKLTKPHSYRGYYSDLAFERVEGETMTAGALLSMCKECMDKTFEGYKGGDFVMDEKTPIWISQYGSTGVKIIDLDVSDSSCIKFATEEDK